MEKSVPALMQEVDAVTRSSEHIAFVKTMLQKHFVSGARRNELFRQLRLAEHRTLGRVLRVAILGEFSSGKSTFINALLGHRLLKSARVATTASATFITYGPKLKVTATFLDDSCIQATAEDTVRLSAAIARLQPNLTDIISIRGAIDLLTTNQIVADAVKRVDISLPSRSLQRGLSIIDTPGIGAGSAYTKNHVQITQSVIEDSADAVIVLIPSAQPMSNTLIDFLQNSAHRFLHRCIFVITAMDTQQQTERQQIWSFVAQCFIKKLGLPNPRVYECAAITALPTIGSLPTAKQAIWANWKQQFSKLEAILFREIARQRSLIISEKLVQLLHMLMLKIHADMQIRQNEIIESIRQLREQNSMANSTMEDYREREHQLIMKAKDISCDIDELSQRQQQLKTLKTKLLMT